MPLDLNEGSAVALGLFLSVLWIVAWCICLNLCHGLLSARTPPLAPTKTCHLCLKKVPAESMESGEHRRWCRLTNHHLWSTLPSPLNVDCDRCGKRLKLWHSTNGVSSDIQTHSNLH